MNTLYLIDGFGGSPKENWMETEGKKLQQYFEVEKVTMTDPNKACVRTWDQDLDRTIRNAQNAYFICHSLGCITLLRYLLQKNVIPKGCVFVSGFMKEIQDFPEFSPFFERVDLGSIQSKLKRSIVISAANDTIVPSDFSQQLANALNITFVQLPKGNHFRASDGILSMPIVSEFAKSKWLNR